MSSRKESLNGIATVLLWCALAFFVCFHFLPLESERKDAGWTLWRDLARILSSPSRLRTMEGASYVMIAGFLSSLLLVVAAPFLVSILRTSRILCWLGIVVSTMAFVGFSGMLYARAAGVGLGVGTYFYMAAQFCNLAGLILLRNPGSRGQD